jgi:hypothetical protein
VKPLDAVRWEGYTACRHASLGWEAVMSSVGITMNRRVVRPIQCFREGWQLIKDDYWLFFGISVVGMLISGVFPLLLQGPMWCGIDRCLLQRLRGRPVIFSDLFRGFDYFGPSAIATLLIIAIHFVLVMIIIAIYLVGLLAVAFLGIQQGQQGGPPDAGFFALFSGVILFYIVALMGSQLVVIAPSIFMYALIVEKRMTGGEAFIASIRAIFANFWGVVGILLLFLLASFAGMLAFLVGGFFIMPIYFAAFTVAYRQVFPHERESDVFIDQEEADDVPREPSPQSTAIQAEWPRDAYPETGISSGPAPE